MDIVKSLQNAICLYRQGRHFQSLKQISQILKSNPHEGDAWELKGLVENALDWQDASIHSLETATTLIPISAAGQYILAKNYLESGKQSLARSVFSIVLARKDMPAKLLPAISSYLGQYFELTDLALQACRKATERNPEEAESWFGMSCYMVKLNYPKQHVVNVLRKAVQIDPQHSHYRIALGSLLEHIGNVDEAYSVVKEIEITTLREIHCSSCLNKLVAIFSLVNDETRYKICRKNLKLLQPEPDSIPTEVKKNRIARFFKE